MANFRAQDVPRNLWAEAFDALPITEKKKLGFLQNATNPYRLRTDPQEILHAVTEKEALCEKKKWVLYTNKFGEAIPIRDLISKVSVWINRFKEIGDTAIQIDPVHAAVPWIIVRTLLQVSDVLAQP